MPLCIVTFFRLLIENVELHHAGTCVSSDFLFEKILFDKHYICAVSLQYGSACDTLIDSSLKIFSDILCIHVFSLQCGSACGTVEHVAL